MGTNTKQNADISFVGHFCLVSRGGFGVQKQYIGHASCNCELYEGIAQALKGVRAGERRLQTW